MDDHRLADLARKQGGVVTTKQILRCGLSRSGINHRVGTGRLFPIRRAAFTLGPVQDATAHHWAAILTTDPDRAMLSHWTAGLVHGMSKARPTAVHVTMPGVGGRAVSGLEVHRSRSIGPDDIVVVD
jgi:predicted transcriptional regulator of viral defense system